MQAGTHSVELDERQAGYERAYPIEIGDDCWVGGNAVIIGPSKIGKGASPPSHAADSWREMTRRAGKGVTIAANACVRGDFPDYCVIGGTPARILKHLEPPSGRVDLSKYR